MNSGVTRQPIVSRTKQAHLAYLEITDFKSYAGHHKLGPLKKGMNCIVGPNGSGKSNLMEAICWVLGVETRHLRGLRMADLAYRKEGESRNSHRQPEVKLLIYVEDAGTEHQRFEERTFTRRVWENRFQFLVDNKVVDKEAYYKVLSTYGILPKVQNCIVSQGQVESLSLRSEKEKGTLFDEVSGSSLLKSRYEELKEKIRGFDLELKKLHEKIKRKDVERKSFEAQTRELEEYEAAEKEVSDLESKLFLFKLYVNAMRTSEVSDKLSGISTRLGTFEKDIANARSGLEEKLKQKRSEQREVEERQNKRLELDRLVQHLEREKELGAKRIEMSNTNLNEAVQRRVETQREVDASYESYRDLAAHWLSLLEAKERDIGTIESRIEGNEYMKLSSEEKSEFDKSNLVCQVECAQLRTQLADCDNQIKRTNEDSKRAKKAQDECEETKLSHETEIHAERKQAVGLEKALVHIAEQMSQTQGQIDTLNRKLEETERQQSESRNKLHQAKSVIDSFSAARREDMRTMRFKETVRKMKQQFRGVFDRLSNLCELTNQTFSTAVSVALGLQADSVVCDSFATAQKAIQYLRREKHPPIEFLPLDRLKVKSDQTRLGQYPALFTPVINCISFDHKYHKAFAQVLEDVVVVDNLDDARDLAYRKSRELHLSLKIVTIDGQKILKNCNIQISGGGDKRQTNRFEERRREALTSEVREAEAYQEKLSAQSAELENQQQQLTTKAQRLDADREVTTRNLNALRRSIENRESILASLRTDQSASLLAALRNRLRELEAQRKELETKMAQMEHGSSTSSKAMSLVKAKKALQQLVDAREAVSQKYTEDVDDCQFKINDLLRKLSLVSSDDDLETKMRLLEEALQNPSAIKAIDSEIADIRKELMDLNKAFNDAQVKWQESKGELNRMSQLDKQLESRVTDTVQRIEDFKKQIKEREAQTYELHMERSSLENSMQEFDTEAADILNEITTKNIPIPTKNGAFEDLCNAWRAKPISDMDDGDGVDVDFSGVPDDWGADLTAAAIQKKEAEIQTEIRKKKVILSETRPNFKARELLEETKEAYHALRKRQKELSIERQFNDDEFSKCRESRCERFKRCFEKTKNALESIYSDLTRGTEEDYSTSELDASTEAIWKKHFQNTPGGVARLELIDEPKSEIFESGICFHAMPPGKRFTEMDALSGGEKSMATLALLFALQSYRQSPFVVLDEVDAALDVSNVQSLRNWLKKAPFQVVIVTLKDEMYCHADAIIGVYKDHEKESSGTLSLDVEAYA
eukprot:Gregarina_sp_Poly_1__2990@NODE_183_length_11787_cov_91_985239_g163_i0_p1_GENE_NODE_183_length_11787_cov_91_985239_g163_i0NODE_183_length_11787_cov_91_985239_g163_i0_p1_ORF_typecomplete_len1275_score262_11SMC_N/PF02463_19/8_4e42SMC_N/PF02463_19/9_5e40SMC_hinge/PF06470_13/3_1e27AAA_15/PF13175_6/1_6e15AAA_15/PF13175_6/3_5AAA_23/PF13476_6/2_6e13AAA_23/PF13476_6/34AAA_21/PF13304_6/8_7e05AAA_21/PF13304_6/2_1e03AAA_21/PF13304_6/4_6e06AAA_29/PF13555_6/6_4e08DUF2813/PF11398_8/6_3e08DUF2813/PF11398_8/5_1e